MTPQQALKVMGLGRGATKADLKSAYRRLAAKCHPDLNPNSQRATALFQQLNAANSLLKTLLPEGPKPQPKAKPQERKPELRSFRETVRPKAEAQKPKAQKAMAKTAQPKTQPVAVRTTSVAPTKKPQPQRANPYAWLKTPAAKGQLVDVYC